MLKKIREFEGIEIKNKFIYAIVCIFYAMIKLSLLLIISSIILAYGSNLAIDAFEFNKDMSNDLLWLLKGMTIDKLQLYLFMSFFVSFFSLKVSGRI